MSNPHGAHAPNARLQLLLDLGTVVLLAVAVVLLVAGRRSHGGAAVGTDGSQAVDAHELGREPVRLFHEDDPTPRLVLVFRSDCPVCREEQGRWVELAELAASHDLPVVALTPEPLDERVAAYFPTDHIRVLGLDDPAQAVSALGVRVVPTTLLMGGQGEILSRFDGRLREDMLDSLRQHMVRVSGDST